MKRIEFLIDEKIKYLDEEEPFEYYWNEKSFGFHELKAIAYDNYNNTVEDTINLFYINFVKSYGL